MHRPDNGVAVAPRLPCMQMLLVATSVRCRSKCCRQIPLKGGHRGEAGTAVRSCCSRDHEKTPALWLLVFDRETKTSRLIHGLIEYSLMKEDVRVSRNNVERGEQGATPVRFQPQHAELSASQFRCHVFSSVPLQQRCPSPVYDEVLLLATDVLHTRTLHCAS